MSDDSEAASLDQASSTQLASAEPRKRWRPALGAVLKIALSLGFLAAVLWYVPVDDTLDTLRGIAPGALLAAVVLFVAILVLKAVQTGILLETQHLCLSLATRISIGLVTRFYGLFVPGYLAGGLVRWRRLTKSGGGVAEMFSVIAYSRSIDTLVAGALALGFVALGSELRGAEWPLWISLVLMASAGAIHLTAFGWGTAAAVRMTDRLLGEGRWAGRARDLGERLLEANRRLTTVPFGTRAKLLSVTLVMHAAGAGAFLLLADAVGLTADWAVLAWVRLMSILLLALPISWGGFGLREISLVALLTTFGIDPAPALGIAVILSIRLLVEAAAGGLIEAVTIGSGRG